LGFHRIDSAVHGGHFRYAADDQARLLELLQVFESDVPLAIACRGGYGVVRLLQKLDSTPFGNFSPKWIAGYSDLTALHCWVHTRLGWPTLHSTMMTGWLNADDEDISVFLSLLQHGRAEVMIASTEWKHVSGTANGKLLGGNLSVLHGLVGTPWFPKLDGAILFLEDIAEPWYKIDRMLWTLAHGGHFDKLKALIVGDFSQMPANDLGQPVELIFTEKLPKDCPVFFGFPAGHEHKHIPLRLNASARVEITNKSIQLHFPQITFP
jgi:muramoyltetrapeptide carboxypeptidase